MTGDGGVRAFGSVGSEALNIDGDGGVRHNDNAMRRAALAPEHHRARRDQGSHGYKPVGNQHRESTHVRRNHRRDGDRGVFDYW